MRSITVLGQRNPEWANVLLGSSTDVTIGEDGCYITSFAMLANYYGKNVTPIDINNYFKDNGLYANSDLVSNDNDLQDMFSDITYVGTDHYEKVPADLGKLQNYIQDPTISVILCIDLGGGNVHFVVCVDCDGTNVTIANPWTEKIEPFSQLYGDAKKNILKLIVYKGTPVGAGVFVDSQTFENLVNKSTKYDGFKSAGFDTIDNITQKIGQLQDTITNLNNLVNQRNSDLAKKDSLISSLQSQVTDLNTQLGTAQEQAKKVPSLTDQINQCETDRQSWTESEKTYNRTIAQLRSDNAELRCDVYKAFWAAIKTKLQEWLSKVRGN